MTLKTLDFLNKIGEACFNDLRWFVCCWGKWKVLCTVKVCIVIVNDKVSAHHRLFVSGHQSRDFTGEKDFYCFNFLPSWFHQAWLLLLLFNMDQFKENYSWTPFSSSCQFIILKINHRLLAIRTREAEIVRSNWSSWQGKW
jgi:hypothetical protein